MYERHLRAVGRYVARRVGTGTGIAEDLAAEVFVRAFRVRDTYRGEHDSALPWLLGIANNLIADHWRAERRRLVALERIAGAAPEIVEQGPSVLAPDLVRALRRLPAGDRDALLLVVWGELSYEEAASALGASC
ncbi:MAG: RNA polymerase sigma factor [Solirubrobacteraceae bacterium]